MDKKVWVVVANNSAAKFFKAENNKILTEIHSMDHPEGRLQNREMNSDKPGRAFSSVGTGRSSLQSPVSPKSQESHVFAKKIIDYLEGERGKNSFTKIYIASPPNFLGILRQTMKDPLVHLVADEVNKDIIHFTPDEIRKHFPLVL